MMQPPYATLIGTFCFFRFCLLFDQIFKLHRIFNVILAVAIVQTAGIIDILQVHEVKDAEVWLHQLSVLLNPTEFEDMKKGLEHRRQDLMDKMDENARFRDQCFEQMHVVLVERPELRDTLVRLMNQYEISL